MNLLFTTSHRILPVLAIPAILFIFIFTDSKVTSQDGATFESQIKSLPMESVNNGEKSADWLIDSSRFRSSLKRNEDASEICLSNGLIERRFRIAPNAATVSIKRLNDDTNILRAVEPEALITIDGSIYPIGGLTGQPNHAYLTNEWLDGMTSPANAMQFTGLSVDNITERFPWQQIRHHAPDVAWPPKGLHLKMSYQLPASSDHNFTATVHYEIYDGIPLFSKWISIHNLSKKNITVDRFTSEQLAVVEYDSRVEARDGVAIPKPDSIHVETDFAFGGFTFDNANKHVVHWGVDPKYSTQVNYLRKTPCLLKVQPTYGPSQVIEPGKTFNSFRTFELIYDSTERERRSLSLRRMYRTIAPWVTENPLMHHMKIAEPNAVRRAIDQAAEVGFEMIILSFGSGFNIENKDPKYVAQWKEIADYAKSKKIEIGGYSLLSSRKIGGGNDIVSPNGSKPTHGNCPALTSKWGQDYYANLYRFYEATGFTLLEHDGPYPGDVDVTPRPPLQKGGLDSRWAQAKIANDFYRWCRERGIYINAPDYYFLNGTNKCGMGYREVNWSLPREMQVIHTRQNIYDGTWYKTPSMGWMFVPLTQYHGGGAAATIEPLEQHLDHYQQMFESNLGLGVQACYRGPRLFDSEKTRMLVKSQVDWFKKYRNILESDVIHGRRADGQDLDWMLHINPNLENKGMLLVYNPLGQEVKKKIRVNLYYTGIKNNAQIFTNEKWIAEKKLSRDYTIDIDVIVPANGMAWYPIKGK